MCGPFVAILQTRDGAGVFSNLAYNLGRTLSYSFVGGLLGFLGWGANRFLFAEIASFVGAFVLVLLGLGYLFPFFPHLFHQKSPQWVTHWAANVLKSIPNANLLSFSMGTISGLLPCGLLFPAYGLALLTGEPWQGGLVMASFSLGTYPMLLTLGLSGQKVLTIFRNVQYRRVLGILLVALAIFTIYNRTSITQEEDCHTETSQ